MELHEKMQIGGVECYGRGARSHQRPWNASMSSCGTGRARIVVGIAHVAE